MKPSPKKREGHNHHWCFTTEREEEKNTVPRSDLRASTEAWSSPRGGQRAPPRSPSTVLRAISTARARRRGAPRRRHQPFLLRPPWTAGCLLVRRRRKKERKTAGGDGRTWSFGGFLLRHRRPSWPPLLSVLRRPTAVSSQRRQEGRK